MPPVGTSGTGGATVGGGGAPGGSGSPGTPGAGTGPVVAGGTGGGPATPMVTCSNTNKDTIVMDESFWVPRECNNFGIQGAWYCYDDGMSMSGCVEKKPQLVAGKGMCLTGKTLGMEGAWGAGIGFSLNDSGMGDGTMMSVKSPYDAMSKGVKGFKIGVSGDAGGLTLRVNFPKLAAPDGVSPFFEVPGPAAEPYTVLFSDALVPEAWDVENAGELADPTKVYDVQVQIPGDSEAVSYNVCITELTPITDGTMMPTGGAVMPYGSAVCGQYEGVNIPNYYVQNNRYGGNNHCIQARTDNGTKAGFLLTNLQANIQASAQGSPPGSYPSLVYGWHVDGRFYGGYTSAKQLSAITSIPTSMAFTVPGTGRYNASYDNWINSAPTAGSDQGTLEQMIWLNKRDATPIGSQVGTVMLAGTSWEVWYGTHDGFSTVSYVRANTTMMNFDIKEFMNDTVSRGYASQNSYLLGIQAGFEIWEGSGNGFSVDSFSVSVK